LKHTFPDPGNTELATFLRILVVENLVLVRAVLESLVVAEILRAVLQVALGRRTLVGDRILVVLLVVLLFHRTLVEHPQESHQAGNLQSHLVGRVPQHLQLVRPSLSVALFQLVCLFQVQHPS